MASTIRTAPRVMWAMNKAVGAAALQPDPESGSLSQKVFAIPRSNWPRRVTTIAAPSARIRLGVVDSAVAVMPTRLPQSEPNDEQQAQGSRHEPGADVGDQGVHHYSSRVPGRFCQRLTVHGWCSRTTPRSLPSSGNRPGLGLEVSRRSRPCRPGSRCRASGEKGTVAPDEIALLPAPPAHVHRAADHERALVDLVDKVRDQERLRVLSADHQLLSDPLGGAVSRSWDPGRRPVTAP